MFLVLFFCVFFLRRFTGDRRVSELSSIADTFKNECIHPEMMDALLSNYNICKDNYYLTFYEITVNKRPMRVTGCNSHMNQTYHQTKKMHSHKTQQQTKKQESKQELELRK